MSLDGRYPVLWPLKSGGSDEKLWDEMGFQMLKRPQIMILEEIGRDILQGKEYIYIDMYIYIYV